jgi:hypothetical protein
MTADQFAAHEKVVIAKICSCPGCSRRNDLDLAASYCFGYRNPADGPESKEIVFFVPKPLSEEGYTVAQLAEIEASLACLGVELLPLDPSLSLH